MMAQNRQAAKDRKDAKHDYEVNLKVAIQIGHLHEELDRSREQQWADLVAMQQEQIRLVTLLLQQRDGPAAPTSLLVRSTASTSERFCRKIQLPWQPHSTPKNEKQGARTCPSSLFLSATSLRLN